LDVSPGYLRNNAPRLISYAVYAAFNALLFAWAAHRYADKGPLVQLARGCGAIMNFNAAFCLLPMMRLFISALRRTRFSRYLALEDSVRFHWVSGHVMFAAAAVHTLAYLCLYGWISERSLVENLMGSVASITGWILLLLFFAFWLVAIEPVRRRLPFELFYVTHFSGIAIVALLLIHSPNYWKWFLIGGTGYLLDRALRFYRMRTPSTIRSMRALPSAVSELVIARPPGFEFRAGDFIFLLIPALSRFEWHPFTISSPPERRETFSLHVRTLGDYTSALHQACKHWPEIERGVIEPTPDLSPRQIRRWTACLGRVPVYIDGPHGAPANDIFHSKVAVLIAAGIGVTPFASILQSLLLLHRADKLDGQEVQKVYFLWINRDQRAFEWFTELLADLNRQDRAGFFDIRLFLTDPPPGELPPLSQRGRPDWDGELQRIVSSHDKNDLAVFFCGPAGLADTLHARCRSLGLKFKEEHF
jgi:predicted ferric reductase